MDDSDRAAYNAVLKRVNGRIPTVSWFDYFLESVELSLYRLKKQVLLQSCGISLRAAGEELTRMVELGLFRAEQKGRTTRNVMA